MKSNQTLAKLDLPSVPSADMKKFLNINLSMSLETSNYNVAKLSYY